MNNFRQAFFVFLALSIPAGLHAEYLFTVTDLGTLGGTTSLATGINAWGQVVGTSTTSYGVSRAFVYWHGVMIDLGTLGGDYSSATAINNVGQVIGVATTSTGDQHAFLFQGSTMTDLGTLGGNTSQANAINDHGQIVGSSTLANGQTRAFLYDHGAMTNLGALGEGRSEGVRPSMFEKPKFPEVKPTLRLDSSHGLVAPGEPWFWGRFSLVNSNFDGLTPSMHPPPTMWRISKSSTR
jgi:probable HAF family extracellular repeat protein